MSESGIVRAKTELPETTNGKGGGKIAKPRKPRATTPPTDEPIDLGDVPVQAEVDLEDVAIAAADAPFARATRTFDERYKQNLLTFGQHISNRQNRTSKLLISQVYGHFGLTEQEIYDEE